MCRMRDSAADGQNETENKLLRPRPGPLTARIAGPFYGVRAWLQSVLHCSEAPDNVTEPRQACTWMCLICGWIYDEAAGDPDHGIAPGTAWADVSMNWTCPECGARKEDFEMVQL